MSAFLRYVVEQAASGNKHRIKAYAVAVDALGKPDSFDPQNDPVVRVLAGRLRASLSAFYTSHPDAAIRIQMKPGTYAPVFKRSIPAHSIPPSSEANAHLLDNSLQSEPAENNTPHHHAHLFNAVCPSTSQPAKAALSSSNTASTPSPGDAESNIEDRLREWLTPLFRFPIAGLLLLLMVLVSIVIYQHQAEFNDTAQHSAHASMSNELMPAKRSRPEQVSIFVNAQKQSNSLEDQLNTLMSGVFAESESLYVYRILNESPPATRWPEDYLISLDVMTLASETHVSVQLVDAQTGRISHADTLILGKDAASGLSRKELANIMSFARQLISEDGPLFSDYHNKKASSTPEGNG